MVVLNSAPSDLSSRSSASQEDVMRLRLAFGGKWERQENKFEYVGGNTYLEKLPFSAKYADLMYAVNEKTNGASVFKYTYPGEEPGPDNLVTVIDDGHVQEMIEAYQMAESTIETPGRRFRLLVWLSKASEDVMLPHMSRNTSWTSEGQHSEMSDGTNSPMIRSYLPHCPAYDTLTNENMQMRIAQEECIYMNDMEAAEEAHERFRQLQQSDYSGIHSPPYVEHEVDQNKDYMMVETSHDAFEDCAGHLQPTRLQYQTGDYSTTFEEEVYQNNDRPVAGDPHDAYGNYSAGYLQPTFLQYQTDPSEMSTPQAITQTSSQENDSDEQALKLTNKSRIQTRQTHGLWPDTVGPQTPSQGLQATDRAESPTVVQPQSPQWVAKKNSYNLPSILGASVGNAHTSYHLPSKLGSELGNTRCGTLHPPTYGLPALGEDSGAASTVEYASYQEPQPDESPQNTPELKQSPSDGTSMDHFHVVPVSEIRAIARLGEGSFGEVLQCSNSLFGQIAVKCAKTEGDKHLFAQEVRMLSSLNHPNVLRFFGVVIKDSPESEIVGVMTEFMQGRSLSHYLRPECKRSSLLQRALLARGAVNGLLYLHKHNIVHFDLKPENLLLDYPLGSRAAITPGIKVADFGLSKYKSDNYASTDSGLRGTVPYMAPEIIVDREHVTEKADIWSLGMVFWEMFTHEVPFGMMDQADIVARMQLGNAYPDIPKDMELEWVELIDGCCRHAPNDRFSLENIAAMLDQIIFQHGPASPIYLY